MARGICPVCESLEFITTTGKALEYRDGIAVGSACYWRVVLHPDRRGEKDADGRWPLCSGSGREI